ncbi:MAG: TIGR03089 family protein [Pseudonocardiales bacterium]|nr:MAG: TIGR03089 family protein [Pseudonocardiales bacterium]
MTDSPSALLQAALKRDPAGPLITYYDDATGERTELSATTLANWVAKTANLLTDDVDVQPGQDVAVLLPAHWQTAVVLLALWSMGARPQPESGEATVVIADEPRLAALLETGGREVVGLSLGPMNRPLQATPAGVLDYAAEVLSAGDAFASRRQSGQLETMAAQAWVDEVGLTGADRVLVGGTFGVEHALDWLLTPLVAQASIVLCRNADQAKLAGRVADERVTATIGVTVERTRRLD